MTEIMLIEGGVCAAQGFTGAGIHCGVSEGMASSAIRRRWFS